MRTVLYRTQAHTRRNWGRLMERGQIPQGEVDKAGRSLTKSQLGFINPSNLKLPYQGKAGDLERSCQKIDLLSDTRVG